MWSSGSNLAPAHHRQVGEVGVGKVGVGMVEVGMDRELGVDMGPVGVGTLQTMKPKKPSRDECCVSAGVGNAGLSMGQFWAGAAQGC